ncbi:MAG: hypothetical protein M3N51_02730 [Actinomycetota bacterium]|nr:hypothetical protein [Actinomycetota bacterium]
MGVDRARRGAGPGRLGPLKSFPIAQVVPDLPTFSVDDGFSYLVPESLVGRVQVGSLVRIPLGGRRVRGYVVGLRNGASHGLKEVVGISGEQPVFSPKLLEALRWCALHYVAPLAVLLGRAAPPNLPRQTPCRESLGPPGPDGPNGPSGEERATATRRGHPRASYLLARGGWAGLVDELAEPRLAAGRSVLVVTATAAEATALAGELRERVARRLVLGLSELGNRRQTEAWQQAAQCPGRLVVGTRGVGFWPVAELELAIVVEEGRRGMKEKQTPTTHVREVLRRRAVIERFDLSFIGRVPTTELLAGGVEVTRVGPARAWPLVEVVDRGQEPPGGGMLTGRARMALHAIVGEGQRAFVFTHRRGYAPAFRCARCRTLRRCPSCGSHPGRGESCPRCRTELGPCASCGGKQFEPLGAGVGRVVEEVEGVLGRQVVGDVQAARAVMVGTERDLLGVPPVRLAVVVDADGLLMAPNYRAGEEALRLLARVACTVGTGSSRAIVQTAQPQHPAIVSLRRGDPVPYLRQELEGRERMGFPPAGEILVLEVQDAPATLEERLREAATGAMVLGPAEAGNRQRWLVQGGDLRPARIALRGLVQHLRDQGARVHVDADPVEL